MIIFDWEKFKKREINVKCTNEKQVVDFFEKARIMGFERYRREINLEEEIKDYYRNRPAGGIIYYSTKNKKICIYKGNRKTIKTINWLTDEEEKTSEELEDSPDIVSLMMKNNNIVVRCKNKNNVRALFKELKRKGIKWNSEEHLKEETLNWNYEENTCYHLEKKLSGKYGLKYGNVKYHESEGDIIIDYNKEALYV